MTTFYRGNPDTMQALHEFLKATFGKPLFLVCEDTSPDSIYEYDEFENVDGATHISRRSENGGRNYLPIDKTPTPLPFT